MLLLRPKFMKNENWYVENEEVDSCVLTGDAPLSVYVSFYDFINAFYLNGQMLDEEYLKIVEYTNKLMENKDPNEIIKYKSKIDKSKYYIENYIKRTLPFMEKREWYEVKKDDDRIILLTKEAPLEVFKVYRKFLDEVSCYCFISENDYQKLIQRTKFLEKLKKSR